MVERRGQKRADRTAPVVPVGKGSVIWLRQDPVQFALNTKDENRLVEMVKMAAGKAGLTWKETNYLALRRGPYVIAAGLDESVEADPLQLKGRFVNLFDPELKVQHSYTITPGGRAFLLDLDAVKSESPRLLASACKALSVNRGDGGAAWTIEGIGDTPAIILLATAKPPRAIKLDQQPLDSFTYDAAEGLLYIRFPNEARPRELAIEF